MSGHMTGRTSRAHTGDYQLRPPFCLVSYPDHAVPYEKRDTGYECCAFCGSLHPSEVVALLKLGAKLEPADRKYGWPHKFYLSNPWGKFYSVHLVDATHEEKLAIEQAMHMTIDYDPDTQAVRWRAHTPPVVDPVKPAPDAPSSTFNGA